MPDTHPSIHTLVDSDTDAEGQLTHPWADEMQQYESVDAQQQESEVWFQ